MERPLRIEYPGAVHHVIVRGNNGQAVFRDSDDRRVYLQIRVRLEFPRTAWSPRTIADENLWRDRLEKKVPDTFFVVAAVQTLIPLPPYIDRL